MALTALPAPQQDWLNNNRPGHVNAPGSWYTALVSDLQVGDYLHGPRAKVTATGATTSGNRALTLERVASGLPMSVSWAAASTVWIRR